MRTLLEDVGVEVVTMSELGLNMEIEETGETFEENALIKAHAVCGATGLPAIADDSGLEVCVLGGAPGVYSARYGGGLCKTDYDRMMYLLTMMTLEEERDASFISCIACVFPDGEKIVAYGECQGQILYSPRGNGGFGYDPVFYVEEYRQSMAEMDPELKNTISHRAIAIREFKKMLGEKFETSSNFH